MNLSQPEFSLVKAMLNYKNNTSGKITKYCFSKKGSDIFRVAGAKTPELHQL